MNSRSSSLHEQSHARGEGQKGGLHGMERQARPLDDDRPELARQEGLLRLMAASPRLQRQCACGAPSAAGGSCAACEAKTPLQGLQHKTLAIGAADDPLELEADQVAERVMRMEVPAEAPLETSWRGGRPMVSRSTDGAAVAGEAPASVHATLTSPGQPLTPAERAFFEPRFGMDFSQVRVHTDDLAQQSARDVHALAYTVGSHVVFGAGRYAPSSTEGQRLLGHELTHVVQQSQAELRVRRKTQEPGVCDPGQLGTLGPDFRKSEADVQKMGLQEKYVIHHPIPDKDFVLYCPHKSTRPLKKLVPCTNVYWIGDADKSGKGRGKAEVWAQQEGETSLYWGFVKKTNLQDTPCVRTGVTTVEHVRPAPENSPLPLNECDDALFCQPFSNHTEISEAKWSVNKMLHLFVFPTLTDDAKDLWINFLRRRPGADMTPTVFKSPDSPLAKKFGENELTKDLQELIIQNIVDNSNKLPIDVYTDKPIFYRVGLLADPSVLSTPLEFEDVLADPDTALTAGGAGGMDRRNVVGEIAIEPFERNPDTGIQYYNIFTNLQFIVQDTIDFCPGKCGSWLEQKALTINLSRLEASGEAFDVPFEIHADIPMVVWPYGEEELKVRVREEE